MPETAGHAPLLLGLLLGNQNNNNGNNGQNGNNGSGATLVANQYITELQNKFDFENQAIGPGPLRFQGVTATPNYKRLTHIEYNDFHRNGFLVLPDIVSSREADTLLQTARSVVDYISKDEAESEGIVHYEVAPDGSNAPSAIGRVIATFETMNKDPQWPFDISSKSEAKEIARLGCGIHTNLPYFHHFTHSSFHRYLATTLLKHADPRITQSQLIAKPPRVGGMIVPHQDGCVSFTDPPSAITFWYALEDATLQNGCLMVAKGSHVLEPIKQRMVRAVVGGGATFEKLAKPVWAVNPLVDNSTLANATSAIEGGRETYVYEPIEVKKGGLILMHGNLMHQSGRNKSDQGRMAYVFTVVDGVCACPNDTYMKPIGRGFDRL